MNIQFTQGSPQIAYDVVGSGEPLVVVSGWASHLELEWADPEIRSFYQRLGQGRKLVRYDKRGMGLSDRPNEASAYSHEANVSDLLAVFDAAGAERGTLLGWSNGGAIALAFAAAHPERVSRLIAFGTYAKPYRAPDFPFGRDSRDAEAILQLLRANWTLGLRAVAGAFIPDSDPERLQWFTEMQRAAVSRHVAFAHLGSRNDLDLRPVLRDLSLPVLVLHRRDDRIIPSELGEHLAASLPDATFVPLDGEHHYPYFGDSAPVLAAIDAFLSTPTPVRPAKANAAHPLSARELDVLCLLAEGLTNREIAERLSISSATVSRHVANIFIKLDVSTRSAASALAFRRGWV